MSHKQKKSRALVHVPHYGNAMPDNTPLIDCIVLAGSRPGHDPLAAATGVATKALVPVAGRPMLDRVARALLSHPQIRRVLIVAQQRTEDLAGTPATAWLEAENRVHFLQSGTGISQSLLNLIDNGSVTLPALVTTVDNVLLDTQILDAFLSELDPAADIGVAMVERRTLFTAYPQSRRTWLKFRGGWWSGANLFWLGSRRARGALSLWRSVEQDRKKGWKILSTFGPVLLAGAVLRLLTIQRAITIAGNRLGLTARIIALPVAEACIDADKPDDVTLIEQILAAREQQDRTLNRAEKP